MTKQPKEPSKRPVSHEANQSDASQSHAQGRKPDEAAQSDAAWQPDTDPTRTKIFPRNLTARAQFQVVGNPVVTRPEDAIANCYPGLELDIRNLDRRFFPGLVFNFVDQGNESKAEYGAKLIYVDALEDPDLKLDRPSAKDLYDKLTSDDVTSAFAEGSWYLEWIEQCGRVISLRDQDNNPLLGLTVWRLIRGLEAKPVSIGLKRRDKDDAAPVELDGWRRSYTDPITGVINGAYQPGELMQGLCSPWQHDFRDCYCHYWASNRPDLVFGDIYPGEELLPGGAAVDASLNVRLDWMRADRSPGLAVEAFGIIEKNRPYQFDHYQINHEWQTLNIVLNGREIDSVRLTTPEAAANPFDSPEALVEHISIFLAPLELTLAFEYLYALFSLRDSAEIKDTQLRDAVELAREYLLLTAVSEMQHLRSDNEILWELHKAGKIKRYDPVIKSAMLVPEGHGPLPAQRTKATIVDYVKTKYKTEFRLSKLKAPTEKALAEFKAELKKEKPDAVPRWRKRALRLLKTDVQQDFINIEHPNEFIDYNYARVLATLEQPGEYPPHLAGLARRILSDGMQHESRFNAIKAALQPFEKREHLYLRTDMSVGTKQEAKTALDHRDHIIDLLEAAYRAAACEKIEDCARHIHAARAKMNDLLSEGEKLAKKDIGIPFFIGI
jgi:hypothetical protein